MMDHASGLLTSGLLADWQIAELCQGDQPMIEPFEGTPVREVWPDRDAPPTRVVSYGLGHYGYDIRVANTFKVFSNLYTSVVDPKDVDRRSFEQMVASPHSAVVIPPNSFALANTIEHFRIPRRVLGVVLGKSTYARCGLIVNCTPLEPEWEGYLTVEISNTTPLPARVYAGEGIAQVLFYSAARLCRVSYADKGGKYQGQANEPTTPRM